MFKNSVPCLEHESKEKRQTSQNVRINTFAIILEKIKKTKGLAGDWTRDLSHPKRESYH